MDKVLFVHFLVTLLSNIRFWSFARLTLPLKFTFPPLAFSNSPIHILRHKTNKFRYEWLASFLLHEGGDGRRPPFTVRLLITCQQDSCSLWQRSSVEWLCKDVAPDSSSSTGILKKHQHHQGQVLSCSGKKTCWKATALSLCPTHPFLETSHFTFSSLTTRWNILPVCIEALNRQFSKLSTLLEENPPAERKMLFLWCSRNCFLSSCTIWEANVE